MPAGRPTKYKKEYCTLVVERMMDGASIAEVCAEIGIVYDTFRDWRKGHEEFSVAVKKGLEFSRAWWEKKGRVGLHDGTFNHVLWFMNMKNRFGHIKPTENITWRDKHDHEVTGKDGAPLQPEKPLTVTDAVALIAALKEK